VILCAKLPWVLTWDTILILVCACITLYLRYFEGRGCESEFEARPSPMFPNEAASAWYVGWWQSRGHRSKRSNEINMDRRYDRIKWVGQSKGHRSKGPINTSVKRFSIELIWHSSGFQYDCLRKQSQFRGNGFHIARQLGMSMSYVSN
jgi:hypothetical protein